MSVGYCTILAMTTWTKYSFACDPDECDTLIEVTCRDFGFPNGVTQLTCPCGRNMNYLSVLDATIPPTNEGEKMLENIEAYMDLGNTYDANALVTYKDINDGVASYPTLKVNELEWKLERIKTLEKQLTNSNNQISQIIDNLSADGWFNPNYEKQEVLNDLCEILGHEPKQSVRITATINVEVDYDIPLDEVEDFDAHYFLQDTLSIDAYNGDVIVDSWTVEDHSVDWSA